MTSVSLARGIGLMLTMACAAQVSPPRIDPADLPLLDSKDSRRELPCKAKLTFVSLGFDLRYTAGWEASFRASDLLPSGDRLRIIVRVSPVAEGAEPLYVSEVSLMPPLHNILGKTILAHGGFALGAGRYRVDWLLRDRRNRACSAHWELEVKHKDDIHLSIPANTAAPLFTNRSFRRSPEETGPAPAGRRFSIKILANFSNTNPRRSTLDARDTAAVYSILRTISREPRFSRFSVVAFNMQEERVIYQAPDTARLDFPALGRAISGLKLGVIDYQRLLDRNSATKFVSGLLSTHLQVSQPAPDAILLVGPKLFLDRKVPKESIEVIAGSGAPVFYLNYVSNPGYLPWRDALGAAVKTYGGKEFRITYPKDLGEALADVLRQLDKNPEPRPAS